MTNFKLKFIYFLYFLQNFHLSVAYRIVNGCRAVSIQSRKGAHYCGGALVTIDAILTAAHCFDQLNLKDRTHSQIRILGNDLHVKPRGSPSRQIRFVRDVIIHPEYNKKALLNDIAVLKLFRKFKADPTFHPAKMTNKPFPALSTCNVSGWGAIGDDPKNKILSKDLLYVNIYILPPLYCQTKEYTRFDPKKQICAGLVQGGKDACYGDSVGGLFCNGTLAGIVSYGKGCAVPLHPGVYTEITVYAEWIKQAIEWDHKSQIKRVLMQYENGCNYLSASMEVYLVLNLVFQIFRNI